MLDALNNTFSVSFLGFPGGSHGEDFASAMWAELRETWVQSLGGDNPLEKEMATNPAFLPGGFHGQRSPAGHSLWYHKVFSLCRQTAGAISARHIEAPRGVSLDPLLWLPGDKGSCLPREANGGKVWAPVPRRLSPCWKAHLSFPPGGRALLKL